MPMCLKTRHQGRILTCLDKDFWLELRKQKESFRSLEERTETQEDYRDALEKCRWKISHAKVQLVLDLAASIKDNKEIF